MKYIKKLGENDLNKRMLEPFKLSKEHIENLYEFFPEGIAMDYNVFAEDHSLLMLIQNNSKNLFLDDNTFVNSYKEDGHEIILGYLDLTWYCGTKEDLEYFINKYVTFS